MNTEYLFKMTDGYCTCSRSTKETKSWKGVCFLHLEDEGQQENEVVIIPAKSVASNSYEYIWNKVDVPGVISSSEVSEIDEFKEIEMLSMVNLKESSLAE